jgi:hypothetical protein
LPLRISWVHVFLKLMGELAKASPILWVAGCIGSVTGVIAYLRAPLPLLILA